MGWGGSWKGDSGWGTHVHPWQIQVNVWQNQYNVVKEKKKKIKLTLCSYAIYFSVYLFFSATQNSENTQNGFGFGFDLSGESITS